MLGPSNDALLTSATTAFTFVSRLRNLGRSTRNCRLNDIHIGLSAEMIYSIGVCFLLVQGTVEKLWTQKR